MNKLIAAGLAGALFVGGMVAPDSWRAKLQEQINAVTGKSSGDTSAPAQVKDDKKDDKAVPYASVQRPLRLEKGQKLGLGLGLFTSTEGGSALNARVSALGYKTAFIAVADDNAQVWQMLIAGEYAVETNAERDRAILADALAGAARPEIVLIPPPPKKK